MKVADISARPAVTIAPDATIREAASMMGRFGVGCLVVTDDDRLVGIVTDRDLVVRAVAAGLPLDGRVDGVMTTHVVAVDRHADIRDAIAAFHHHAVRRMPVVDGEQVTGLVSLDDLMVLLAKVFGDVTHGLTAQLVFPHAGDEAPVPAIR
ncbi:MAG: CBS domain-containing protein [Acidimicrobiales bacterium]|nr:CBS domain-containing protein [Acidimicrobiales bacterium]